MTKKVNILMAAAAIALGSTATLAQEAPRPQPVTPAQTATLSAGEIAFGRALQACLDRPQNAKSGGYVYINDVGRVTAFYPKETPEARSVATGCNKEANFKVRPKKWTGN